MLDPKLEQQELDQKVEQYLQDYLPEELCLRVLLKMCFYISVVRKIEILQIHADFFVDQNDKVWFFHAKDIVWRHRKLSNGEVQQILNTFTESQNGNSKMR